MQVSGITGQDIARAASVVRKGGIVAFPTETYYGLGVDPFNEEALARLFAAKNRPTVKPVLVLIHDRRQISLLAAELPDIAFHLMDSFWPGPLTLVLPARKKIPSLLTGDTLFTGDTTTIGIRLSPHPVARKILESLGSPVTATSANLSGDLPAVSAEEVSLSLGDKVDMILDGGTTPGQQGSTLVGVNHDSVEYIREGCISFTDIRHSLLSQNLQKKKEKEKRKK